MQSHHDGECWGMDLINGGEKLVTSGDDNKILVINPDSYKVEKVVKVGERRPVEVKKPGFKPEPNAKPE